jgi:hypothetical protein
MNFHINSIESFSAHPDGHSCLVYRSQRFCETSNKKTKMQRGPAHLRLGAFLVSCGGV